ncbi:MAG: PHP domain-containing protein [bacterium]|nr:PHP domain-containing protein [bacterium]
MKGTIDSPAAKYIDLHTHTVHSDGALTPTQLVQRAKEVGLSAIAISDHENTEGIDEAKKTAKKFGIEIVSAVEVTSYPDPLTEHHMLGYFIDYKSKILQKALRGIRDLREKRAKKVIDNLNSLDYSINFGDVKALAQGTIVQPHIAWVVITDPQNREKLQKEFGFLPNTGDFIRKYLVPGAPAYESRKALKPKEAVELIHKVGGVAVFAHPCWTAATKKGGKLIFDDKKFEQVVKAGIDGVEALAHRENEEDTRNCVDHFTALAKKHKLAITGGSDYHGFGSAGKELGFQNFYLKVPYQVLEELKSRIGKSSKF